MTNRTGASGSMHPVVDNTLRAARAWRNHYQPSTKELSAARRLAHKGATWQEIAAVLKWSHLKERTIRKRFKTFNILVQYNARAKEKISARFNGVRHYPEERYRLNNKPYRPKIIVPAQA